MSRISVFGLGYVGTVSAVCLANQGHFVVGVDTNKSKVDMVNAGVSPIVEAETSELVHKTVSDGHLRAAMDTRRIIDETDISLICVGTPSKANGSLDLAYVQQVCRQIGEALRDKEGFHVVVGRSTVLPGSTREVILRILETDSGKKAGVDFGICHNPEFLREGTAVHDFLHPPKTVIGELDVASGDRVAHLYDGLDAPLVRVDVETAEMVKYVDNTWHATKICFANEIGNLCKALGLDGHRVMDIFCLDTKLNISASYMKPGFAFGGSCLPKDVRALTYQARMLDLELPLLSGLLSSNKRQVERGLEMIIRLGNKKIGILGFSFKAGTDDLRESPLIEVIERLLGKGYDIKIYDKNVNLSRLIGRNREYLLHRIPHICNLMVDHVEEVLHHAQTIVIGNRSSEFRSIGEMVQNGQAIVDFVRVADQTSLDGKYQGICW